MSHFYATIQGNHRAVSRCGTRMSGIEATLRSPYGGIKVVARQTTEGTVFDLYTAGGRRNMQATPIFLGRFLNTYVGGMSQFTPASAIPIELHPTPPARNDPWARPRTNWYAAYTPLPIDHAPAASGADFNRDP